MKIHNYGNDYVAQRLVRKPTIKKEVENAENTINPISGKADKEVSKTEEAVAEGTGDAGEEQQETQAAPTQKKGKKKRK